MICGQRGQGQTNSHKLHDSERTTRKRESQYKSSLLPNALSVLFTLSSFFSLVRWGMFTFGTGENRETIKVGLLGNGSCVLHHRLTPPHLPTPCGCHGNMPWEAVLFEVHGEKKPVDAGQSEEKARSRKANHVQGGQHRAYRVADLSFHLTTDNDVCVPVPVLLLLHFAVIVLPCPAPHAILTLCQHDSGEMVPAAGYTSSQVTATSNSLQWGSDTKINRDLSVTRGLGHMKCDTRRRGKNNTLTL